MSDGKVLSVTADQVKAIGKAHYGGSTPYNYERGRRALLVVHLAMVDPDDVR